MYVAIEPYVEQLLVVYNDRPVTLYIYMCVCVCECAKWWNFKQVHFIPTSWFAVNDFVHCALSINVQLSHLTVFMHDQKCRTFDTIGRSISLDLALWFLYGRSFCVLSSVKELNKRKFNRKKNIKHILLQRNLLQITIIKKNYTQLNRSNIHQAPI